MQCGLVGQLSNRQVREKLMSLGFMNLEHNYDVAAAKPLVVDANQRQRSENDSIK